MNTLLATLFLCLLAAVSIHAGSPSARLRGQHFDALGEFLRSPDIDAALRGKTLKELGIEERLNEQTRRGLMGDSLKFITVSSVSNDWICVCWNAIY